MTEFSILIKSACNASAMVKSQILIKNRFGHELIFFSPSKIAPGIYDSRFPKNFFFAFKIISSHTSNRERWLMHENFFAKSCREIKAFHSTAKE